MNKNQAAEALKSMPLPLALKMMLEHMQSAAEVVLVLRDLAPKDSALSKQADDLERTFHALVQNQINPMVEAAVKNPTATIGNPS